MHILIGALFGAFLGLVFPGLIAVAYKPTKWFTITMLTLWVCCIAFFAFAATWESLDTLCKAGYVYIEQRCVPGYAP